MSKPRYSGRAAHETNNAKVAEYYDTHQFYYSHFWSPTALHYGLWYSGTRSLAEAITNTNSFVVRALNVGPQDVLLDAGCGVGGTSRFIAEATGARVEGVTLSSKQVKVANALAAKSAAASLLHFSLIDYCNTEFDDASFSKIVAIESVCHTQSKSRFLQEARRLLGRHGQVAVVDAFLAKDELSADEQEVYEKAIDGWRVPNLASINQFSACLTRAGFVDVNFVDLHEYIWPSVDRIYRFGLLAWPINFVKSKLGLAPANEAARYQKAMFRRRIATYGMFVGTIATH